MIESMAGDRQARRRAADADRPRPRHPPARRLRLCAAGRLRPQTLELVPDILAAVDVAGRAHLHLPPAQGPPLVGRPARSPPRTSASGGRTWRRTTSLSPTGPQIQLVRRRRAAEGRDPGRAHRPLSAGPSPTRSSCRRSPAATQLFIYRPAHYLKQFHEKYAEPEKLKQLVAETKSRDWVQLFLRKDRLDKFDNPDMPTLQPWMLTTRPPAERFIAVRNPYFHRVDAQGPAAALHRPVHARGGRRQAGADQDRCRRDRPAGPPSSPSRTTPS